MRFFLLSMEDQIRTEFLNNNFTLEDDETAEKCASLCMSFGMEPEMFVSKWELFYLNQQLDGVQVLKANLDSFKQFLERDKIESFRKRQTGLHYYTRDDVDMKNTCQLLPLRRGQHQDLMSTRWS